MVLGNPFHRGSGGPGGWIILDEPELHREHVAHVWPIDPRLQTLEAFALSGARYQLLGAWRGAESARVAPFEELDLELAALWAR